MNIPSPKTKVKNKVWYYIKDSFYSQRVIDSPIVLNINTNCNPNQKKALLCYLPYGYFHNLENHDTGRTIQFEIFKIVKVFSDLDYCIDIVGFNDIRSLELIKSRQYNLIFGFGETFYQITKLQPTAVSVLYMTENHPEVSFKAEMERINYFYARHKKHVPIVRSGQFYKSKHVERKYSQLITLGEIAPFRKQYDEPFTIFPTGIINSNFVFKEKDQVITRKHFLWLGSNAVIHKGLDLLIDVFNQRKGIYLHVCGLNKEARRILQIPMRENIIDYGYINIQSETFIKIVETCSYSILPSCSEGFATSITTSMLHGLIPVVMKDIGFNRLNDKAIFLDDYKVEYLDSKLTELINYNPKNLNLLSNKVFDFAHGNFLISVFEENLRKVLLNIINENKK
jgi:hypothetical protein